MSVIFIYLFLFFNLLHLIVSTNTSRIINGEEVYIYDHPYLVYMADRSTNQLICGGSIVNRFSILTAGHCVYGKDPIDMVVVAGYNKEARDMQLKTVKGWTIHPEFVSTIPKNSSKNLHVDFDYAIVHLSFPIKYTLAVQWVTLAHVMDIKEHDTLVAMGWGMNRPKKRRISPGGGGRKLTIPPLKGVSLNLVNYQECVKNYSTLNIMVTDRFFCAASNKGDTCQGDSGGPIVMNNIQYGITSYAAGCFRAGYPSVFAKVPIVFRWIAKTAKGSRLNGKLLLPAAIFIFCQMIS